VQLADLGLRVRERFLYEYDFIDNWQHDVRLEQILRLDPRRRYPGCIAGRRDAPLEDCGGPWAFLELRQHYSIVTIADRLLALLSPLVAANHDDSGDHFDPADGDAENEDGNQPGNHDDHDHAEELPTLLRWLRIDSFDRRAVIQQLAQDEMTIMRAVA